MTNKQPTRASQTREKTERKKVWTPPSYLDTPNARTDSDTDGSGLKFPGTSTLKRTRKIKIRVRVIKPTNTARMNIQ